MIGIRTMSTGFEHESIHKEWWVLPNGKASNKIDSEKHARLVKGVRNSKGADAGCDHTLVTLKVKEEVPMKKSATKRNSKK